MTKEEAIKVLKDIIDYGWLISDMEECAAISACEMAIEALEHEHCDDCISREAVLGMQYRINDSATLSTRDVVNVDDIGDLPPVTPKPNTDVLDEIMKEIEEIYADIDDVCIRNGLNLARRTINKHRAGKGAVVENENSVR